MLPPHSFPLTVHRLVVAAGANRDFNPLHHNSAYAQASGAPEMYANNFFLQGMWEKTVRAWIGPAGTLRALNGFRMRVFSTVGQTVVVRGRVLRTWRDGDAGCVEIALWSETAHGTTVGPGRVVATVPLRQP
ncbi:acyl dehydratase [Pseudorhodoferax sp. Leaf267]|nr:acyl dehydratase [Pseudorhodoferax sp. Leaf267]